MPGSGGDIVECIFEPAESYSHLVNKVLVIHVGLIRHAPSSVDEMQLSSSNNVPHLLALLISGLIPPPVKEGNLHNRELVLRMFVKLTDDSVNGVLHSCKLGAHVASVVIVINRLEPSNIIMRMRDDMDSDFRPIWIRNLLMVFTHHVFVVET